METLNYRLYACLIGHVLTAFMFTGCKSAQEATGWHRTAPDAASVQPLRALEIPPGFQNMPSDQPSSVQPSCVSPKSQVPPAKAPELDQAEQSLLQHVQPHPQ